MTPAQELLMNYMSQLSEDYYSAGWLVDLEYVLWDVLEGNPKAFAAGDLTEAEVQKLRTLSEASGGWIHWNKDKYGTPEDSEDFIPLEEWKTKFAEWKKR